MKNPILTALALFLALALVACGSTADNQAEDSADFPMGNRDGQGMGPGGMGGMGPGMMARHMAAIPEEYEGLTNPVPANEESLARGEEIYTTYCLSCHGQGGLGEGPAGESLEPPPAPIAHTSQMLGDDYLFWRISEGGAFEPFNSAMPAWKQALDEQARWDVINYIRALGSGQVMPGPNMSGPGFSATAEAVQRTEMLVQAVAEGVITQEEADTFNAIHQALDEQRGSQMPMMGNAAQVQAAMLDRLVEAGEITEAEAEAFADIHDRLVEAGLMQ